MTVLGLLVNPSSSKYHLKPMQAFIFPIFLYVWAKPRHSANHVIYSAVLSLGCLRHHIDFFFFSICQGQSAALLLWEHITSHHIYLFIYSFIYLFLPLLCGTIGREHIMSDPRILRKASEHRYDSMLNICPIQFVKSANVFPAMLVIVHKGLPTAGFY